MNKKILSALLLGALTVASTGTLVSCKDYDDDIANLQKQIDENRKSIEQIEALIKGGSVITGTTTTANGVTVTLSDGSKFELTNGKDGAPGTAWTIGSDGYWYCDKGNGEGSKKTDYKALGEDGDPGQPGTPGTPGNDGKDGKYYVPNEETNTFWVYNDGDKEPYDSHISFLGGGSGSNQGVTAVLSNSNIILNGVQGTDGSVVLSLTGDLRSLVFKPYVYFDGIETIEYPWLGGNYLKDVTSESFNNRQNKTVTGTDDWQSDTPAYVIGKIKAVDYHMNPANSSVESSDVLGFAQLNSDIYYTSTRAAEEDKPVVKYSDKKFATNDGILTAGLEIEHADKVNQTPTSATEQQGLTVALQAKNHADGKEQTITSDYALVMPVKAELLGIAWNKKPTYYAVNNGENTITGDMTCPATSSVKDLVFDTPKGALQNADGAALELYYDNQNGISLIDYLSVHYQQEKINNRSNKKHGNILPSEMGDWNLSYDFKLVDYTVDGNVTGDSKYAKMLDSKTGKIRACNVKADGTEDAQSATAVGREPLVQVLVKHGDKVVLDGYILIHITSTPLEDPDNKVVTAYDEAVKPYSWDLCDNENLVVETNWSQFSKWILTDAMNNMTKGQFDTYYQPDVVDDNYSAETPAASYELKQFKDKADKGGKDAVVNAFGKMTYFPNTLGTTNHRFDWTFTGAEIEELTHEKDPGTEVEVVRYFRFKAVAPAAPYPYVYVKVTAKVKRTPMITKAFGEKNLNYWYTLAGIEKGTDAIVFDVKEPRDGANINTFANTVNSTLKTFNNGTTNVSQPAIKDYNYKYYFVPKTYEITAMNGKKYTITTQKSVTDTEWNVLDCKWIANDGHKLDLSDKNTRTEIDAYINAVLNKCAIKYSTSPAFNRTELYAVNDDVYTKIATMNATNGEITLENESATKDVLNAIGFVKDHENINTEMRAWVGLIVQNTAACDLATQVTDQTFLASWQRPINMIAEKTPHMVDANTNGNYIYAADMFKLYDWRGIKAVGAETDEGQMWGDNLWFWAYYGVKKITVTVDPAKVKTNMHFGGEDGLTNYDHSLAEASTAAELYALNENGTPVVGKKFVEVTINDLANYNAASKNDAFKSAYFGEESKKKLGGIFYKNNGDNVAQFTIVVPVTISYTWGDFTTMVPVIIKSTLQ